MKPINMRKISVNQRFITRDKQQVKFIQYISAANPKNRLLFLLNGNILACDEEGKCWSINNHDASYTDTDFTKYDVFVDDVMYGWVNLYIDYGTYTVEEKVYSSFEEAKNKSSKNKHCKTIKIEWSEDESEET